MGYLQEKVSYIRGLADGLGIESGDGQGRVLLKIIELLEDFADSVEDNEATVAELNEAVESISEDLSELEDSVYDMESDMEIRCPHCGEMVDVDADVIYDDESEMLCPYCEQPLLDDDEDEDDDDDDEEDDDD